MTKPCRQCKAPVRNWRTCLDNLCGLCFAKALDEANVLRGQFEALLVAGMSNKDANAEMIRRIEAN